MRKGGGERTRGMVIGRAIEMIVWLARRRAQFRTRLFAEEFEISTRNAQRWLLSLEASGLVESDRSRKPWIWRPA